MIHTYKVSGMTCSGCQTKVQSLLSKIEGVKNVTVDLPNGEVSIEMDKHINTTVLSDALIDYPKYQLTETKSLPKITEHIIITEDARSFIATYKPLLLIFAYIIGITLLIELVNGEFIWMRWMHYFMAGFFLIFSFFKLLNLKGFAESYSMYDIVAKKWKGWGYIYAFTELGLGIAFLTGYKPLLANSITFVVMSVSIIGVLQSVFNKQRIKCACLGEVFNLPMSSITVIEDALMIAMSFIMIVNLL